MYVLSNQLYSSLSWTIKPSGNVSVAECCSCEEELIVLILVECESTIDTSSW